MLYRLILSICVMFVANVAQSQVIVNVSNSICQVDFDGIGNATAFCVEEDDTNYYLLTAGHVVDYINKMALKYDNYENILSKYKLDMTVYHTGVSQRYENCISVVKYVYELNTCNDIALLSVKKEILQNYKGFSICKFSERNQDITPGRIMWTYGCPNGGWPTAVKGSILVKEKATLDTVEADKTGFLIYPPAKFGRSGSPVLNFDARKVIGMVILTRRFKNGPAVCSTVVPFIELQKFLEKEELDE